jgi:glucose-6-phosphate isomerase
VGLYKYESHLCYSALGISAEEWRKVQERASNIVSNTWQNATPELNNLLAYDSLAAYKQCCLWTEEIHQKFDNLIIIGMGGAILNPASVVALQSPEDKFKIFCLHDLSTRKCQQLAHQIDLRRTAFLVISKSGDTIETIALTLHWLTYLKANGINDFGAHFFFITDVEENKSRGKLGKIAQEINAKIMPHANIGGRFATFTNITILPGLLAGLDMEGFIMGGHSTLHTYLDSKENSPAVQAGALLYTAQQQGRISTLVNMSFLEQLNPVNLWYRQILAESLGKEGRGFTPVAAAWPMDQHSQMQLYLEGPRDKLFTAIYANRDRATSLDFSLSLRIHAAEELDGSNIDRVQEAQFHATLKAFTGENLPVRQLILQEFSTSCLGALMMHIMLETITFARLAEIDPFGQPAVEMVKRYTREGI